VQPVPGRYEFSLPERRQRDGWFRIGNSDITTTALLVVLGVGSMVLYAVSPRVFNRLALFTPLVRDGEVWRLITWPLANSPEKLFVILTLIFFWFIGHQIEERVGRKQFTVLVAVATVVPATIVTAVASSAAGFEAGEAGLGLLGTGLFVLFALDAPNTPFFFGIPAWILAAVFVSLDLLRFVGWRAWGLMWLELFIIAVMLVMGRQYGLAADTLGFIPNLSRQRGSASSRSRSRSGRARNIRTAGPKVVNGPWGETGFTPTSSPADQAELDGLLDKISAGGMDSLSKADKQRLNELSKRLRGG
jgi:membrane associated rhomboid family serine protease